MHICSELRCGPVHNRRMPTGSRQRAAAAPRRRRAPTQRQTVLLPDRTARRVKALARAGRSSVSRTVARLIETGLDAEERQRAEYLELIERLAASSDASERRRIKEELRRRTFES